MTTSIRAWGRAALLASLWLGLAAPSAPAQIDPTIAPQIVAERGDPLACSSAGALLRLEGFDVDGAGRVVARAVTGLGQRVVIRDLDLLLTLDGVLPSGQVVTTDPYEDIAHSTDGRVAWIGRLDGDGESALLLDRDVALAPGDALTGPDVPEGSQLLDARRVVMNDAHQMLLYARIRVGSKTNLALLRLTPDAGLTAWSTEILSMRYAETPDGLLVRAISTSFDIAEDGAALSLELTYTPEFPQFTFGGIRRWPGYELLSPWPGVNQDQLAPHDLSWSADGQWAACLGPNYPAAPTPVNLIVLDGATVASKDDVLPGQSEPASTLRGVRAGANDNLAFLRRDQDTDVVQLYLNDRLVLSPGDVVGGRTIESIELPDFEPGTNNPARPYALDRAGETLWASVLFSDGEWALLRIDIGPWVSLGGTLAGPGVVRPRLAASGSLQPGTPAPMAILDGPPGAPAYLVVGLTELSAPFKAGVLVPSPDLILGGLTLDANGRWATSNPWPADLPAGVPILWQAWMPDPSAPVGFAATPALRCTTP